jgi:hypothetical protein
MNKVKVTLLKEAEFVCATYLKYKFGVKALSFKALNNVPTAGIA